MYRSQFIHLRIPLLLVAALRILPPCQAQATKAEVLGTVRDPSGGAIFGARTEILNRATGAVNATTTSDDGSFHLLALTPGTYQVSVTKAGFKTVRREGVTLSVGDRLQLDIELRVADLSEMVEVTEPTTPMLQDARGSVGFVVDQKKIVTLPLDGRNFVPLIALSPGVNLPPGSVLPRINGSRPRVSEYIYDGISVLQPEPGQVAYYPIIDAVQEFRVETNSYSAEYGRSNGGVIMVTQRSGSNEVHGTLFEFFRNEKLNARNLFATSGSKPRFRRNQYGFVLGGPAQKNKTFFFVDWQGTRLNTGVVRLSTVPTSSQRKGIFSTPVYDPATTRRAESGYIREQFPGNSIPTNRFDPARSRSLRFLRPEKTGLGRRSRRISHSRRQFLARFETARRLFAAADDARQIAQKKRSSRPAGVQFFSFRPKSIVENSFRFTHLRFKAL